MLTITAAQAGQRIDNFLLTQMKGVPRTRIYRALRKGEVRVNKGRINAMYRLKAGDVVRIPPIRMAERTDAPAPSALLSGRLQSAVLYENSDFIVVNKPAGLAVHGGSGVQIGLIEAFRQIRPDIENLYLIHRLDRDTSGCLLLAKNREAMLRLQTMMRERAMTKEYVLLVHGRWAGGDDRVCAPLKKEVKAGERLVVVDKDGKYAETHFNVIQHFKAVTLLRARLVTGRTHQIRVHAQHMGHSILGDKKYGDAQKDQGLFEKGAMKRLFLHAERLSFGYPDEDGRQISITAPGFHVDDFTGKD